jgi:Tol biopolymer transport system component
MPVTGGAPRVLPELPRESHVLSWTSDGRQLLLSRQAGSPGAPSTEIWSVPVQGGEARKLTTLTMPGLVRVQFHPDGRHLAFSAGEDKAEVWVIEGLSTK